MRFVFVFAHPDDETVACGGTIKQLCDAGHDISLIVVTDGGAGEVHGEVAQQQLKKLGTVAAVRRAEMEAVTAHLGIARYLSLEYPDGTLTNQVVWGKLKEQLIEYLDAQKPDVVVTFDHAGWYYHLDHVGVSIATTRAYHETAHRPRALLLSHFHPVGTKTKWRYVFPEVVPATHQVVVSDREHKVAAMQLHHSQDLSIPQRFVREAADHAELYQVAFAEEPPEQLFAELPLFQPL